ncbi:hypothetical protein FM036_27900 [Nostoc sp. HG1]|nr:hypothetical protein [Nostoc sp. HG1]
MLKRKVRSLEFGVWSLELKVWSLELGVLSGNNVFREIRYGALGIGHGEEDKDKLIVIHFSRLIRL